MQFHYINFNFICQASISSFLRKMIKLALAKSRLCCHSYALSYLLHHFTASGAFWKKCDGRKSTASISQSGAIVIGISPFLFKAKPPLGKDNFDFLGFTFFNTKTRTGKYRLGIRTSKKKLKMKRQAEKKWLYSEVRQLPVPIILERIASIIRGHINYYGVNGNLHAITSF